MHSQDFALWLRAGEGGFWAERQRTNRNVSLRHGYEMLDKAGNFHNLKWRPAPSPDVTRA